MLNMSFFASVRVKKFETDWQVPVLGFHSARGLTSYDSRAKCCVCE